VGPLPDDPRRNPAAPLIAVLIAVAAFSSGIGLGAVLAPWGQHTGCISLPTVIPGDDSGMRC
jgi:hypothetical protein